MKTLSNKQFEIMQIIWGEGTSLTFSMICVQRKGFLGIHYRTEFFGMSQYYYPIIKADAYLRYCMERLQELTGKKIILVEPGGMTHE